MNKTISLIIVVFLLLAEFTFGQSVAFPDPALEDLKSTNLSRANLSIYEEQAILKWQDVLDYIAIIGSQKYNLELRETALKTTLSNFDVKAKLPCNWLLEPKGKVIRKDPTGCASQEVFQALLESPSYELEVRTGRIKIQQNLRKIAKDIYQGELVYEQEVKTKKNKTTNTFQGGKKELIRIQFLLKRMDKQFGSTTEVVWEVKFLGMF